MIRDQQPHVYSENNVDIITIVRKDPLTPSIYSSSIKLKDIISSLYYGKYKLNVFRGEGSVRISMKPFGAWTGERRAIRHFLTSTPQVPLIGKVKEPRISAHLGDIFVLHRESLTFIPAECLSTISSSLVASSNI